MNAPIGKRSVPLLPLEWMQRAACVGEEPELFFGPDGEHKADREAREAVAKQVCAGCRVRPECLDYAGQLARHGVYGGLTEEEREQARLEERRERKKQQRRESYYRCDGATRAGRAVA